MQKVTNGYLAGGAIWESEIVGVFACSSARIGFIVRSVMYHKQLQD
jgi:hypothetical protein